MVNETCRSALRLAPLWSDTAVEWKVSSALTPYSDALAFMDERANAIRAGQAAECVWLLEHPPLYTAGTSARPEQLLRPRFPVHTVGRGGQFTYHGPGQRVAYVLLDLQGRGADVRCYVGALEHWLLSTLAAFGIVADRREDRVGVWVPRPERGPGHEDKIAAIGVRIRRWVTMHGVAVNLAPDLSHFDGIIPCGVRDQRFGVTSLADLGRPLSTDRFDAALRERFEALFGRTVDAVHAGGTQGASPPKAARAG